MKILEILDKDLKSRSKACSVCGLPKNGVIPVGKKQSDCGICICEGEYESLP